MLKRSMGAVLLILVFSGTSFGTHPLITDDTGTQGKGNFQVEINYEFDHDNADGVKQDLHQAQTSLSYGITDTIDFSLSLPYQFITTSEGGEKTREDGISDMVVEAKWRFFERDGLSFAVKPGISLPTGNDEKGLGTGRVDGAVHFIATREIKPWAFHLNVGYGRNETTRNEETNIWDVSVAAELEVCKWLKVVANVGAERNTDKEVDTPPAFILGGLVFPVTENLDLDIGVKGGLTKPETDYALLSGVTIRF